MHTGRMPCDQEVRDLHTKKCQRLTAKVQKLEEKDKTDFLSQPWKKPMLPTSCFRLPAPRTVNFCWLSHKFVVPCYRSLSKWICRLCEFFDEISVQFLPIFFLLLSFKKFFIYCGYTSFEVWFKTKKQGSERESSLYKAHILVCQWKKIPFPLFFQTQRF